MNGTSAVSVLTCTAAVSLATSSWMTKPPDRLPVQVAVVPSWVQDSAAVEPAVSIIAAPASHAGPGTIGQEWSGHRRTCPSVVPGVIGRTELLAEHQRGLRNGKFGKPRRG